MKLKRIFGFFGKDDDGGDEVDFADNLNESIKDLPEHPDEPIVTFLSDNGLLALVRMVDGRDYKLQHPGVRTYREWRDSSLDLKAVKFRGVTLMEQAFRHVVHPAQHNFKPGLDNIHPGHYDAWDRVLTQFLEGSLGK